MIESFTVQTNAREEFIDITGMVEKIVSHASVSGGICVVYIPHTTAAVTINENADPSVRSDILKGLGHIKLEKVAFSHAEGNSPAHIKSSIIGCSITVIFDDGRLCLGTWQGIYLCEFDGPRTRKVMIKIV